MTNMLCESAFFGVVISLLAYELGMLLKKKFGLPIFNPLLISIAVVIVFLAVFDIDYQNYNDGAKYLSYLLTPATVCLAIPLYEQMEALKKEYQSHPRRYSLRRADEPYRGSRAGADLQSES